MAYSVGHVSGGHFNPAVTLGLAIARRFRWPDVLPYVVTQVVAAWWPPSRCLRSPTASTASAPGSSGFATNGYGDRSPGGYSLLAVIVVEVMLTAVFLYVILGRRTPARPRASPRSRSACR